MNGSITELKPIYDNSKSFYGKARIYTGIVQFNRDTIVKTDDANKQTLYSYDEPVCYIENGKLHLLYTFNYSATTLRHVKEFLKQHGLKAESKKQIERDYFNKLTEIVNQ